MQQARLAAVATVIALAAVVAVPRPAPTQATHTPDARLPDLAVLAPRDFRIVVRDSGRRLLRFTTIIVNIGRGPFQLSGYDDDGFAAKKDILSVKQQILEPDGTFSPHNTTATMFWAGDGHDHWHVTGLQVSKLQNLADEEVGSVAKVGFCFVDNYRYGSSKPPHYTSAISVCQTKQNGRVPMGVSTELGRHLPVHVQVPMGRHHRPAGRKVQAQGHCRSRGRSGGLVHRVRRDEQRWLGKDPDRRATGHGPVEERAAVDPGSNGVAALGWPAHDRRIAVADLPALRGCSRARRAVLRELRPGALGGRHG